MEVDFVKVATVIVTPGAVASKKTPPLRTAVMAGKKGKDSESEILVFQLDILVSDGAAPKNQPKPISLDRMNARVFSFYPIKCGK